MFSRVEWGKIPVLTSPTDLLSEVDYEMIRIHNVF
ncbi:hypothetical protein SAMN05443574_101549 [Haloarcula vallismortis]|uniref:Uncharacterized protein n=1 Tax=Haloarcula vallismortis TaxID=28442 RepID=A0A1H2R8H4_HALVA|nr:hypothetical protein SAMN05443574_101549 [Haloarcula vallismortis]